MAVSFRTAACGLLAGATAALALPALPVSAATTTHSASATHRVHRGDSLWLIARRNHTSVAQLVQLNKAAHPSLVRNPRLIYAGWVLNVR